MMGMRAAVLLVFGLSLASGGVAGAASPVSLPLVGSPPPPPSPPGLSRFSLGGQKFAAPHTHMSQAGIAWSLTDHLTFHLRYERTGYAPIMSPDHDDGVLTGVQINF